MIILIQNGVQIYIVYNQDFRISRNDMESLVQLTANTYILPRVFYAFSNNYQLYFDDQIQ
jgi:hypothetical protein